jgi:hypothetical protein
VRLGEDNDWKAVVGMYRPVFLLKANGALRKWDFPGDPAAPLYRARARRLGSHSDWVAICAHRGGLISLAADGSLWFRHFGPQPWGSIIRPLLAASRRPQLIGNVLGPEQ